MTESFITISIVGLIAGFVFSMPVAGPISILITSNALKGKTRYCYHAAVGASFADFFYVFIAVLGLTRFYQWYKPAIPYILIVGSVFLFFVGYRILRTRLQMETLSDTSVIKKRIDSRGGFWTGFLVNFLNPTLFLGWLTSSFITLSLVASLGFNMGGLDSVVKDNVKNMEPKIATESKAISNGFKNKSAHPEKVENSTELSLKDQRAYHYTLSALYAGFLSIGSIIWFYMLAWFIIRNRHRINIRVLNNIIKALGLVLCFFSVYLAGRGIDLLI
jgi:threonine/homoserine/homoserine lactone efflux protein